MWSLVFSSPFRVRVLDLSHRKAFTTIAAVKRNSTCRRLEAALEPASKVEHLRMTDEVSANGREDSLSQTDSVLDVLIHMTKLASISRSVHLRSDAMSDISSPSSLVSMSNEHALVISRDLTAHIIQEFQRETDCVVDLIISFSWLAQILNAASSDTFAACRSSDLPSIIKEDDQQINKDAGIPLGGCFCNNSAIFWRTHITAPTQTSVARTPPPIKLYRWRYPHRGSHKNEDRFSGC